MQFSAIQFNFQSKPSLFWTSKLLGYVALVLVRVFAPIRMLSIRFSFYTPHVPHAGRKQILETSTYFYYRWLPRGFLVHLHLPILFDVRGIPYGFLIGLLRTKFRWTFDGFFADSQPFSYPYDFVSFCCKSTYSPLK